MLKDENQKNPHFYCKWQHRKQRACWLINRHETCDFFFFFLNDIYVVFGLSSSKEMNCNKLAATKDKMYVYVMTWNLGPTKYVSTHGYWWKSVSINAGNRKSSYPLLRALQDVRSLPSDVARICFKKNIEAEVLKGQDCSSTGPMLFQKIIVAQEEKMISLSAAINREVKH